MHWINDGLMAIFFLLVGMEIKREVVEGELSRALQIALPDCRRVAASSCRPLIYAAFNRGRSVALHGWAIPSATDIAFAVAVLARSASAVPLWLKLPADPGYRRRSGRDPDHRDFLHRDLSALSLALAAGLPRRARVSTDGRAPHRALLLLGVVLWLCVLKSGVHATLSGVALALSFR